MDKKFAEEISFGKWLRQRRRMLDLTQQQLADQAGCARITLRRIESGALKPSKELAKILMENLDTPPTEHEALLRLARGRSEFPDGLTDFVINKQITNLPVSLTTLIGREKEKEEIEDLLTQNRLVTLAGAGGVGKTRLAVQVGKELLAEVPNGAWFAAFDSLSDPALVPATLAAVFDIREGSSDRPLIERLIYSLQTKTTLLIFDNCEHVLDACALLIKQLLTHCPSLKILTTSREVLGLEGEAVYNVPSLSAPTTPDLESVEHLRRYESTELFIQRAQLVHNNFSVTPEKARDLVQICQRLDGIPLAIELAAAHVDMMHLNEILKQLNTHFDLLSSHTRNVIPRHQTMRASLEWSWGLLSNEEQKFMTQLAVFAGGWTLESAQAVCVGDALNLMSSLVKKSLVTVEQKAASETRYRLHEIVRQYAHEKLIEAGEEENIHTQHLNYFLKLSEQAEPALRGPAQIEWMAMLTDERDNIRAALTWADKTDVEAGLYLSSRLGRFWESFDLREGSYWLSIFIQKRVSKVHPKARAMALRAHLPVLNLLNQRDAWQSTAKEYIELYRTLGDQPEEMDVSLIIAWKISDIAQRMHLFQQALSLAQASGDIWRQARALYEMGWHYHGDERLDYWQRAIPLFRQAGDWRSLAQCLSITGNFALLNGDLELAQKSLDEATLLNDELKDKETMIALRDARARIAMKRSNYNLAHIYWQEALSITEDLGGRLSSLFIRTHLGYLALREGNLAEALRTFTETVRGFFNDKNEIGVVFNLEGIASLNTAIGKFEPAAILIGWTDMIRERISDRRPLLEQEDIDEVVATCLTNMGEAGFSEAYDKGQKMTLDEAVKYALGES